MKHWTCAIALLVAALLPWSALAAVPPARDDSASGRLVISGSSTMAPLLAAIAKRFQTLHPAVQIEVSAGGSGRGLADARTGKADIGMVSRAMTEAEQDLQGLPIARDGVALLVHRDNPVRSISDSQVQAIYTGRLSNWKQLGGRDAPILAVTAEPGRGSADMFGQYFRLSLADLRPLRKVGDNSTRIELLTEHSNAILYMSVGEAERSAAMGAPIRLLPVAGVPASSRNIRNGDYPIARALTLVTRAGRTGLAKTFLEFCVSSQITDLVIAHDFVPYLD